MNQKPLEEIAARGDDLETLEALRQKVSRTIDNSNSGRDIAALSRQLLGIMEQISLIKAQREADADDEIQSIIDRHRGRVVRNKEGRALYEMTDE